MAMLISPMIVPLIISAAGMYFFYSRIGLQGTYLGVILAHAALGTPFVIITVTATLVGFDRSLVRAAQNLGREPGHDLLQGADAADPAGRHLGRAVRLHHLLRRGRRRALRRLGQPEDAALADVHRAARADLADHPGGRDHPGHALGRAADRRSSCCAAGPSACGACRRSDRTPCRDGAWHRDRHASRRAGLCLPGAERAAAVPQLPRSIFDRTPPAAGGVRGAASRALRGKPDRHRRLYRHGHARRGPPEPGRPVRRQRPGGQPAISRGWTAFW